MKKWPLSDNNNNNNNNIIIIIIINIIIYTHTSVYASKQAKMLEF